MKNVQSLVCSFITAFLLLVTSAASAHKPPPKQNNLVLLGTGETLELAFLADCNGPQGTDDAYIVEPEQREIIFDVVVDTQETRFVHISAVMRSGSTELVQLPASTYGNLFKVIIENVSGQGVCKVSSTGRVAGASGETRGANLLDTTELWFIPVVNPDG